MVSLVAALSAATQCAMSAAVAAAAALAIKVVLLENASRAAFVILTPLGL